MPFLNYRGSALSPLSTRRAFSAICVTAALLSSLSCSTGESKETPKRLGLLRFAVSATTTLDPAVASNPESISLAELISLPLVQLDPSTSEVLPGLAKSWRGNKDQTSFTFNIDQRARFSAGALVGAADVKASLERVVAPGTRSPIAGLLSEVVGYDAAHSTGGPLEGIVAKNATTVVFNISRPDSTFPISLGHPGLGIVAPDVDEPGGLFGTGPYRVSGIKDGDWEMTRLRGPGAQKIRITKYETADKAATAVETGNADIAAITREAGVTFKGGLRPVSAPYVAVSNYALNLENPKFANVDFREAILRALNSVSLVRKTFGPTVGVANGVLPETVAGHGENPCRNICDFNLAEAKAAVSRAFPAGGVPTFSIDYDDTPAQASLALAAQAQLRAAGIETTPRAHPISDYDDFLANGEPDLFRLGWVALDPSAEAFLFPVFASGAPENVAHIKSLASDLLVISASTTGDPKKRAGLYAKAERAILQQVAIKPVVQYRSRFIARSTVKALSVDALGGIFSGYSGLRNR